MNAIVETINWAGRAFVEFALPMFIQSSVLILILLLLDVPGGLSLLALDAGSPEARVAPVLVVARQHRHLAGRRIGRTRIDPA